MCSPRIRTRRWTSTPTPAIALYNWELFYHAPFLIANSLSTNQQFQRRQALVRVCVQPGWAGAPTRCRSATGSPSRSIEMTAADYANEQITALMQAINQHDPTLEHQVAHWRADPFDPDAIAQLRPVAYQRAIVMKYIDNLIAWGDQLFTQDTMETINQATQLYVLAADLLGPRPEIVPPLVEPDVRPMPSWRASSTLLQRDRRRRERDPAGERQRADPARLARDADPDDALLPDPAQLQLLGYWDTVADRLFKIRHCMNIEGVVQQLPLFAPPINPGLLVAAAAAGLDLSSVLCDISRRHPALPVPHDDPQRDRSVRPGPRRWGPSCSARWRRPTPRHWRGSARPARASCRRRSTTSVPADRRRQPGIDVLAKAKQTFQDRPTSTSGRPLMNDWEAAALILHGSALIPQTVATVLDGTAAVAHALPTVDAGAAGVRRLAHATVNWGGSERRSCRRMPVPGYRG